MKKYWCVFTCNKVWLKSAINLYNSGIAEPVLWTGDDRNYFGAKKYFGDAAVRKKDLVFYPEELKRIKYSARDYQFFISENYSRAKDRCLKMMDRLDLYGSYSRLDRDVIFNKLVLWLLKKFEDTQPDAFISSENPHSHSEYLMYEICSYKNVPTLKFNNWMPVPVLYAQNINTGNKLQIKKEIDPKISKILDDYLIDFVEKLSSKKDEDTYILPVMKIQQEQARLKNKIFKFLKVGFLMQIKEYCFQFRKYFSKTYYPINPYKFGYFSRLRIRRMREKRLLNSFRKSFVNKDLEDKFVFYALHFEPERTTTPDGNQFHDQIIALTFLRAFVPQSYKIYVKEHPSQFLVADRGSRGRSPLYYDVIQNISNLFVVNPEIKTEQYIRKSQFVATISGSAGFEASIMGKKALIFGDTWYNGCPNTFQWNEKIDFDKFINSKMSSPNEIIKFLISQKNLFTFPGLQNYSASLRFKQFLDDNIDREIFESEQLKGVEHIMKEFLKNC